MRMAKPKFLQGRVQQMNLLDTPLIVISGTQALRAKNGQRVLAIEETQLYLLRRGNLIFILRTYYYWIMAMFWCQAMGDLVMSERVMTRLCSITKNSKNYQAYLESDTPDDHDEEGSENKALGGCWW